MSVPRPTVAGVRYASVSPAQALDLWIPGDAGGSKPFPVMVFAHGGAFRFGTREWVGPIVAPALQGGLAVASIDYRLSAEATFPAAVRDAKAAVRWLRKHAEEYRLDPWRVAGWGESSGGNLMALLGVTGDQSSLFDDTTLADTAVSAALQAVVDWYGPMDFSRLDLQAEAAGCDGHERHDDPDSHLSAYLGAPIPTVPEAAIQANPATYLASATEIPPFRIAHGGADCTVPTLQSVRFANQLLARGAEVTLDVLPGAGHVGEEFFSAQVQPTVDWLLDVLSRVRP